MSILELLLQLALESFSLSPDDTLKFGEVKWLAYVLVMILMMGPMSFLLLGHLHCLSNPAL